MRYYFILLFLLNFFSGYTQKKIKHLQTDDGDLTCVYKKKFTDSQRLKFYPFNMAYTVKLVSYPYHKNNSPIRKDTIYNDSLKEVRILTTAEVNQLTDILYNNFVKKMGNIDVTSSCFIPRNGILFFDKKGNLKEAIIICFHCDKYGQYSKPINVGEPCSEKSEKLRIFFIGKQVMYGTNLDVDSYPGETY